MPPQLDDLGTKQVISGTPASDDLLPFYDISEFGNDKLKKTTVADLLGGAAGSTDTITTSDGTAAAAAGDLGEYVSNSRTSSSQVTLSGTTAVLEISLTPGDWDVQGHLNLQFNAASVTSASSKITSTAGSIIVGSDTVRATYNTTTATENHTHSHPPRQVRVSTTTTYYLNVSAATSAGDVSAYGFLSARRVR